MIREFKDIKRDINEHADVLVIGSGAGGAVAAKELAEKGIDVILIEEGSYFTSKNYNQDPNDMMGMMWRDSGTTLALGLPPVSITLGKAIGGTTLINSATCFRTPETVIEKWRKSYGCEGLDYKELLPYFEKVENEISVTELSEDVLGAVYQVVKRGAKALGLSAKPLRHNVKNCEGAGICQFGCPRGAKQSTDVSYIPKAIQAGARIFANCRATKLLTESGRIRGVKGKVIDPSNGKAKHNIHITSKIVCLAMGAMITPAFLLKQRLANTSGQVGKNLTIHPCGRVVAEMEEEVNGHHGVSQGGQIDAFAGEGIMLEGIFLPPGLMTMSLPGVGEDHKYIAKHYKNLAAFGVMVSDTTRGRVFRPLLPGFPFSSWYSLNKTDTGKLKKGIEITAEIFFEAGAKRVFTGCTKMPILNSKEDLEIFKTMPVRAWHFELAAFHPLGTCRFGNDPGESVVDMNLESHDIKGLFIPDGSPFPTSLGVNPQVTIMAFATRTSDYIAESIERY
ncbi:MAG: GMC family oxidoreductase [Proteobacteria bacterium]|nr:GMC family oxidoreductase [Pseudomonadota bacterium]